MYALSYSTPALALSYENERLYFDEEILDQSELIDNRISPLFDAKSFEEYVRMKNEFLVNSITSPPHFDRKKIVDLLTSYTIDSVKKDPKLYKFLNIEKRKGLNRILEFVESMLQNMENDEKVSINTQAENFLSSDFPLSFFTNFLVLEKVEEAYLHYLKAAIKHYKVLLSFPEIRNNQRRRLHILSEIKQNLYPFFRKFEDCMFSKDCLSLFIFLYNSDSYDDLFKNKRVTIKKLDQTELKRLQDKFEKDIDDFNQIISKVAPEHLYKEMDNDSPVAIAFSNVMSSI